MFGSTTLFFFTFIFFCYAVGVVGDVVVVNGGKGCFCQHTCSQQADIYRDSRRRRRNCVVSWMKELKKGGGKPRVALKDVCTYSSS